MEKIQLSADEREQIKKRCKNVARHAVSEIVSRIQGDSTDVSDIAEWITHFLMSAAEAGNAHAMELAGQQAEDTRPLEPIQRGEKMGPGMHRVLGVELKPCPFCGSEPYLSEVKNQAAKSGEHRMCIQCSNCLARTKVEVWKLKLPESPQDLPEAVKWKVINAWNQRN